MKMFVTNLSSPFSCWMGNLTQPSLAIKPVFESRIAIVAILT